MSAAPYTGQEKPDAESPRRVDATAEAVDADAPVVRVKDGSIFIPDHIVRVADDDEVFVVEKVRGDHLTVRRGVAGTEAAAIPADSTLYIIGVVEDAA